MTREENITYDLFESGDRIWPPNLAPSSFLCALKEVLTRLPDDAYDVVSRQLMFVIEIPQIIAVNVPFSRIYPAPCKAVEVRFDTVVVFHQVLSYSHEALVGLLAHELAHSLASGKDYRADEEAVEALTRKWGFEKELQSLGAELNKDIA